MRVKIKEPTLFQNILNKKIPEISLSNINGITTDSRQVEPGDIFLALKGDNTDGHKYIKQAKELGAIICFVERKTRDNGSVVKVPSTKILLNDLAREYRNNLKCPLIGVTGTNGKTTTKELLAHVLSSKMNVMCTKGNFNSTIGVPLSIFECSLEIDIAIIEMGANKPGEIEYICDFAKPSMGIITNVSEAHIEHFGSIETVANTKSALFSSLPSSGTAFVNIDDKYISKMDIPCTSIEYSTTKTSDYYAGFSNDETEIKINGTTIRITPPSYTSGINALAAFSISSHLGLESEIIKQKIESFQPPSGRGNIINVQDYIIINDSYNANLESTKSGINKLIAMSNEHRKVAVIGDMLELGELEVLHHRLLGEYLSKQNIDAVFAFGNLTRHTISELNGSEKYYQFYENKYDLIKELRKYLHKNDHIYIKGSRGMKMEEIIQELQK